MACTMMTLSGSSYQQIILGDTIEPPTKPVSLLAGETLSKSPCSETWVGFSKICQCRVIISWAYGPHVYKRCSKPWQGNPQVDLPSWDDARRRKSIGALKPARKYSMSSLPKPWFGGSEFHFLDPSFNIEYHVKMLKPYTNTSFHGEYFHQTGVLDHMFQSNAKGTPCTKTKLVKRNSNNYSQCLWYFLLFGTFRHLII